ncbi:hypothetical protein BGZ63DRAFT_381995 [Mariannaea sp. PMI_226]|nr:hypothetical protein BGZ63DRAFT_381995 [Mariannaea sp. PMI_226]
MIGYIIHYPFAYLHRVNKYSLGLGTFSAIIVSLSQRVRAFIPFKNSSRNLSHI